MRSGVGEMCPEGVWRKGECQPVLVAFLEGECLAKEAGLSQGVRCHSADGIRKYQERWVRQMGF